jgi:hypothetical protein
MTRDPRFAELDRAVAGLPDCWICGSAMIYCGHLELELVVWAGGSFGIEWDDRKPQTPKRAPVNPLRQLIAKPPEALAVRTMKRNRAAELGTGIFGYNLPRGELQGW